MSIRLLSRCVVCASLALLVLPNGAIAQTVEHNPASIALEYLDSHRASKNAPGVDDTTLEVRDQNITKRGHVSSVYVRQRLAGIEIHGVDVVVIVAPDGTVLRQDRPLTRRSRSRSPSPVPILSADEAIHFAAQQLQLEITDPLVRLEGPSGDDSSSRFTGAGISIDEIPVRLTYVPMPNGELRLAWNLNFRIPSGSHFWDLFVDAENGAVLKKYDWVQHDSYRVYDLPLENPLEGARTLVSDPAEPAASPFGWHDTNGIAGAEYLDTRGNNVAAQEDAAGDNSGDGRPSGGSALNFDYPLDLDYPPSVSESAAVTQLFYMVNRAHDIFYAYGFDEASGNYQHNNYGRGGISGDPVWADAQDGASINNARFTAGPDGHWGLLEMFLFNEGSEEATKVIVNNPPGIGTLAAGPALFGPRAGSNEHPGAGDLVRALDQADDESGPSTTDGCSAILNPWAVSGKIALIDRGDCFFTEKVANAQDADAIGVIISNNAGNSVVRMAPADPRPINIPAVFVGQDAGAQLASALAAGSDVNVTLVSEGEQDSSLDTGIVIHEYAHGVTGRLTGGASNANCLQGGHSGAMGEGWSDFFGLAFTAKPSDEAGDSRPIGTFVYQQPATGSGVRTFPYDTDFSENPLTFEDVGTQPFWPHSVGEVWAVTLWELYWGLVEKHGFDPDLVTGNGGNNRALSLVIDGLKLQGCDPTFLDARDAILLADEYSGGSDECVLWKAFAKRGMGTGANDFGNGTSLIVSEDFSVPIQCVPEPTAPDLIVLPPSVSDAAPTTGQTIWIGATVKNQGAGPSGSATLRYYRSANSTIETSDTYLGSDSVVALTAGLSSSQNIEVSAPSTTGTYYLGACVDSVSGESSTSNNCSSGKLITVTSSDRDEDGVLNSSDNCPDTYNPSQSNLDSDSTGDACDSDIDGDSFTDEEEIAAGSDPLDINSIPAPEPTSVLLQLTALLTLAGLRRHTPRQ